MVCKRARRDGRGGRETEMERYHAKRIREAFLHGFRTCPINIGLIQNLILKFRLPMRFDSMYWYGLVYRESKLALIICFDLYDTIITSRTTAQYSNIHIN